MRRRILVLNVPATTGGALAILRDQHTRAAEQSNIEWIFVVSTPQLPEAENIKILSLPWTKRSIAHRAFFELVFAPILSFRYKPQLILNLDNIALAFTAVPQIVYIHQAQAFIRIQHDKSIMARLRTFALRHIIRASARRARLVLVQTAFMRSLCIRTAGVPPSRVRIQRPRIGAPADRTTPPPRERAFIYPANAAPYKNHRLIVEAVRILLKMGQSNFRVRFTLNGTENRTIRALSQTIAAEELPIDLIGHLDARAIEAAYRTHTMLYVSQVESFGLPLYEARSYSTPIIATNTPHSREALDGYNRAILVPKDQPEALALEMARSLQNARV